LPSCGLPSASTTRPNNAWPTFCTDHLVRAQDALSHGHPVGRPQKHNAQPSRLEVENDALHATGKLKQFVRQGALQPGNNRDPVTDLCNGSNFAQTRPGDGLSRSAFKTRSGLVSAGWGSAFMAPHFRLVCLAQLLSNQRIKAIDIGIHRPGQLRTTRRRTRPGDWLASVSKCAVMPGKTDCSSAVSSSCADDDRVS